MRSPPTASALAVPRVSTNTITIPTATGSNLTPSSSPEPGTSPLGLAAHGWQSFIDEKDEKWSITGDEGVRLIDKEDDGDDEEDEDEDEDEENKSSDDDKYTGDVNKYEYDDLDIFSVTKDQLKYYCQQFIKLTGGSDNSYSSNSLVNGSVAREFFEKSKLPFEDLSRIWILADQDKDGSLNVVEFCIAMHLVVLRRKSIDLPTTLPSNLLVSCNRIVTSYSDKRLKSGSSGLLFDPLVSSPVTEITVNATTSNASHHLLGREQHQHQQQPQPRQQYSTDINNTSGNSWTRFSPTSPPLISPNSLTYQTQKQSSQQPQSPCNVIVSDDNSPSNETTPAPVNFDFKPISILDRDPKVVHPIARRLTPEVPASSSSIVNGISSLKFPLPPPPPPRTSHRHSKHARSSSLDLSHISRGNNVTSHHRQPHASSSLLTSPTEASFNSLNHTSCNFNRKPLPTTPPSQAPASLSTPQCASSGGSILHEPYQGAFTIVRKRVPINTNNVPILSTYSSVNLTRDNCEVKLPSDPSLSNFYVTSTPSNVSCSTSSSSTNFPSLSTVVPASNINISNDYSSTSIHLDESDHHNNETIDTLLQLKSKYSLSRQSFIPRYAHSQSFSS